MKERNLLFSIGMLCLVLIIAAIPFGDACAKEKVYKWRFMTSYTPGMCPLFKELPDLIDEATEGAIQLDIYFFGEHPFSGEDIWSATRDGKVQIGDCNTGYVGGIDHALALPALPFIVRFGWDQGQEVMKSLDPIFSEIMAKRWNIKPLCRFGWPGQSIFTTFPIVDNNSLKGKKIRVNSEPVGKAMAIAGATPMTVSWGEVYTGLQQGVIDGATGSISGAMGTRWQDICKHITRWPWVAVDTNFLSVNLDALNKLPQNVRTAFIKTMAEFGKRQAQYNIEFDYRAMAWSVDRMHCTINPSMLDVEALIHEQLTPMYKEEIAKAPEYGQEIFNIIKKSNESWATKNK